MRGRHQLQLNRNMTKVNAPGAGEGRQGHKGSRLYVRVPINGARRSRRCSGQLPPAEEPSSLFAHSIGLASGVRAQRTLARHVLYAPRATHRECTIVTSDVRAAQCVRNRCAHRKPRAPRSRERERERGGHPSDCKRQPRPRVIATRAVTFRIKPER